MPGCDYGEHWLMRTPAGPLTPQQLPATRT